MSWNTGQSKSADGLIDNTPNLMLYCNFSVDKLGSSNWLLKIFVDCLECNVKIMVSGWSWLDCTMYFSLSILIFYLSEWSVVSVPYQFLSFILAYGTIFFFFDLCFDLPENADPANLLPSMTFNFAGADMALFYEQVFYVNLQEKQFCLAMFEEEINWSCSGCSRCVPASQYTIRVRFAPRWRVMLRNSGLHSWSIIVLFQAKLELS